MLLDRLAGMGVEHAVAGGDLNDAPGGPTFRAARRRPPGLLGRRPLGRRAHLDPAPTPTSASTRSSPRGHRGAGLRRAAGPSRGVTETDLRAATDHLPVLAALRVPADLETSGETAGRPRRRRPARGRRRPRRPSASASPAWRSRRGSRRSPAWSATRSCPSRAAPASRSSTGPPSTPSQANFAVASAAGSGGGSGGTKWPSSSSSKSSSARLGRAVVARADAGREGRRNRPAASRAVSGPSASGLAAFGVLGFSAVSPGRRRRRRRSCSVSSSARSSTDLNGLAPGGSGGSSPYPATIAAQAASSSKGTPCSSGLVLLTALAVGVVLSHLRPSLPCRCSVASAADEGEALLEDPVRVVVQRRHVVALFQHDLGYVRGRDPARASARSRRAAPRGPAALRSSSSGWVTCGSSPSTCRKKVRSECAACSGTRS